MAKQKQRRTWNVKKLREPVRLSQCMIVKNEEKNIERALTWAKDIAFEQIVVDTGSTDRTVEIAKRMGAKVFHFEWINDFAAAKNFAIDKAKGNWIAFLDADEYFVGDDITGIFETLKGIQQNEEGDRIDFIRCSWAHLNDEGKPFMVNTQDRIFRNLPDIRYHGSIHEQIARVNGKLACFDKSKDLTIFHTGYMQQTFKETNKANRNVELLRKAMEDNPDDVNLIGYLGESLFVAREYDEAAQMLRKLLDAGDKASSQRRIHAYTNLGRMMAARGADTYSLEEHYKEALEVYPNHYDFLYGMAATLRVRGSYYKALEYYDKCEEILQNATEASESYAISRPQAMYLEAMRVARELEDSENTVKYAIRLLRQEKHSPEALMACLRNFFPDEDTGVDESIVFDLLSKLYDLSDLKDKLFLIKYLEYMDKPRLTGMLLETFTPEEKEWFDKKENEEVDGAFATSMFEVARASKETILMAISSRYKKLDSKDSETMEEGMKQFGYWGVLDSLEDNYEAFNNCADAIKSRHADYMWLHRRLCDARSKNILLAIILNWTMFDFRRLMIVREKNYPDYFDQELMFCNKDEVFVDVGAYNGDTSYSYIKTYGGYSKIYCYEPTPELYEQLCGYMSKYEGMELRSSAVGEAEDTRYLLRDGSDGALNRVVKEETDTPVTVVSLDEDIEEPVTFIKLDIEGMEMEALKGAARHIREEKPKLAVSVYHSHTQMLDVARYITELNPNYKLYMRYYGGNLLATRFVILAVDGTPEKSDWRFNEFASRIKEASRAQLIEHMKRGFDKLEDNEREALEAAVKENELWGGLSKENEDYEAFENCADFFVAHGEDIEWLYGALADARSKNTLFAMLSKRLDIDTKRTAEIRDIINPAYFDTDIISIKPDAVFVDIGAKYGGDTLNFIGTYGNFGKIYCYDDDGMKLKSITEKLKGVSNVEFMLNDGTPLSDAMASVADEKVGVIAEIAKLGDGVKGIPLAEANDLRRKDAIPNLDNDLDMPVSLIKLELPGKEEEVLRLAARHLREEKPMLAIALNGAYEDLISLPKLVLELNPEYVLRIRCYGVNNETDRFVLYAI